jgi:hypothetical protein
MTSSQAQPDRRVRLQSVDRRTGQVLLEQGRLSEARRRFWSEATSAERRAEAEALAEAALGLGGMWVHEHRSTLERARVASLQRRSLRGLDPSSPLACRLRMRLAAEHAYVAGDAASLVPRLEDARGSDDPIVLAEALSLVHHCLLGPHHGRARLATADELLEVAASTGREVDALLGLAWRTVDLFLAGDRRAGRSLRELRQALEEERCDSLSYVLTALDVMLAIREGRLDDAEEAATACYELGQEVGDADAFGWYGAQLISIRWMQGRCAELLPLVRELAESPTVPEQNDAVTAAIAALAAEAGELDTARSALASLRVRGLRALPSSSIWMVTLLAVCEAAFALGDQEAAREAYDLLAPFADLPVMVSLAIACYGSAHRPLGLAAWTIGDLDLAIEHLEAAAVFDLALGNGPCHAIATALLADALAQRDRPGDRERATTLRRSAIEAGTRFGLHARVDEWRRQETGDEEHPVSLRLDGRVWGVRLGDRVGVVPDSRGMRYLAQLVANVGRSIPAIELASGYALVDHDSHQPILDSCSKRAYREQVAALQEEIDDADRCADIERSAWARLELDRLLEELAAVTGLAGATRSFGNDPERARVSVYKALKRAVATIVDADPDLGREIGNRLVTGAQCVFLPRPLV